MEAVAGGSAAGELGGLGVAAKRMLSTLSALAWLAAGEGGAGRRRFGDGGGDAGESRRERGRGDQSPGMRGGLAGGQIA